MYNHMPLGWRVYCGGTNHCLDNDPVASGHNHTLYTCIPPAPLAMGGFFDLQLMCSYNLPVNNSHHISQKHEVRTVNFSAVLSPHPQQAA